MTNNFKEFTKMLDSLPQFLMIAKEKNVAVDLQSRLVDDEEEIKTDRALIEEFLN